MPLWAVIADVLAAVLLVLLWYFGFLRYNRRRAQRVLGWICASGAGRDRIVSVRWISPSRFYLKLHFPSHYFRDARFRVHLLPREMPLNWLLSRIRGEQEVLTFEADLDCPPAFNLEVHNYCWSKLPRSSLNDDVTIVRTGPVVLTTRRDWQQDLSHMMGGLLASRDCHFQTVCFRRHSPHFSATLLLACLDLQYDFAPNLFEALRELATGASTAMF
jgi:hypothetical protein